MSWEKVNSYRQELTDKIVSSKIVSSLENGKIPWQMPWVTPFNPVSETVYNGVNRLSLGFSSMEKGYGDPRWRTFKQAQKEGWKIKSGEKASRIEHWQWTKQEKVLDDNGKPMIDKNGKEMTRTVKLDKPICNIYAVFNATQVEGMPPLEQKHIKTVETAEKILDGSGAKIEHGGNARAYYNKIEDKIVLPEKNFFKSTEGYYGVALHELAHWTGHESRLNRDLSGRFGSESYAKEELRAELASSFINHELGTTRDTANNAAYIQSWIKVLKDDKNEIFKAAYDADKISNYVMEFGKEKTFNRANEANEAVEGPILAQAKNACTDIIINVPREIKDEAKELGAKWNAGQKTWYIPKGEDMSPFKPYLPEDGKLTALKDTPLFVPFNEKDNVKGVARWNEENKTWYLPAGEDVKKNT